MKIILFGASGTVGKAVLKELSERHEIIKVGQSSGDYNCDIKDIQQIEKLFRSVGSFDAVISTVGHVKFLPFAEMTPEQYEVGLKDKLMGQVNLVIVGKNYINEKGSFTLTSGILSEDPIYMGSSASMVDGAIDAFVRSVSIEMPKSLRINAVSPTILTESLPQFGSFFRGFESVSAERVALAYAKSVESLQTGKVFVVK